MNEAYLKGFEDKCKQYGIKSAGLVDWISNKITPKPVGLFSHGYTDANPRPSTNVDARKSVAANTPKEVALPKTDVAKVTQTPKLKLGVI